MGHMRAFAKEWNVQRSWHFQRRTKDFYDTLLVAPNQKEKINNTLHFSSMIFHGMVLVKRISVGLLVVAFILFLVYQAVTCEYNECYIYLNFPPCISTASAVSKPHHARVRKQALPERTRNNPKNPPKMDD